MKKILLILICLPMIGFTQSVPQGINYQALARDANGNVLMNQTLMIQFSVISDVFTSSISWQETHSVTTNDYGLFTAFIGQGISTSVGSSLSFDVVDWSASNHFLKVEIDYGGGFIDMGTTAFMSVPYSIHAETAETASNVDPTDELQTLTISGDTLFINPGNYIVLPSLIPSGCTDSLACNYDASANTDDGSCLTTYGCTDSSSFNYNATASCDDGSCIALVYGCTSPFAYNWNPSANVDDGSCITSSVSGCTDSTAFNYNASANYDDGSCIPIVTGCTNTLATNYNAFANTDDNSCNGPCVGCTYQGGVVFYVDGNGGGLIVAASNQSTSAHWGCQGTLIPGALGTAIGTGYQNTIDILSGCSVTGTGADICSNLTLGGYNDWYLPSKDELHQLNLSNITVGGLNIGCYMSSTQVNATEAWMQCMGGGSQFQNPKDWGFRVRAIRGF